MNEDLLRDFDVTVFNLPEAPTPGETTVEKPFIRPRVPRTAEERADIKLLKERVKELVEQEASRQEKMKILEEKIALIQRKAQDGAPLISRPFELHEAFSMVGFGGIQFEGGDCWLKQFPDQYADEKPLPPRAVRFWVEA